MSNVRPRKSMEPYLKDEVKFYDHQIVGIRTLARLNSFLLADDMGLGKSLQALALFVVDIMQGGSGIGIVVCPLSLKDNWAEEIQKFTRIQSVVLGREINPKTGRYRNMTKQDRDFQITDFAIMPGPKILILNYEQVAPHLLFLNALKARVAIFDEAHAIKNSESKRTGASLEIKSDRSFVLTGTPLLNNVTELWPLLNRIAPNTFNNPKSFASRYAVFGGDRGTSVIGSKNTEELNGLLVKVMLRRLKADVLDLPEVQYIQVPVPLSPLQEKLYEQANDDLLPVLQSADPGGKDTVIENVLTQFLRLKQICGTPFALSYNSKDPAAPQYEDESVKLDLIVEKALEKSRAGEKVVIFTQFRGVLEALARRMAATTPKPIPTMQLHGGIDAVDRQAVVRRWTEHKESMGCVLLCMSQVAGVGFNMVAARTAFFADKLFVPGLNQQCVDRLHRIGQSESQPVQIFEFIARGTVESRIEAILRDKKLVHKRVIEDVELMRSVLRELKEQTMQGATP